MSLKSVEMSPECTHWCKSRRHALELLSAISVRPPTDRLQSYCRAICHNFPLVVDDLGRNVLHFGASCGDWRFVRWLLEKCHSDVDTKDGESGWTPLHRSLYYGQLSSARVLMRFGANLNMTDRDSYTPLDLLMLDRPPYIEFSRTDPCDCYVWGSNDNFNLGVESEQSRKFPEIINTFKRDNISIKRVCIQKFHSLFLSNDGKVYTCGHGHGGRLGHDSEDLAITPKLVHGLGNTSVCEMIASGQDHMILLVRQEKSVQVYSCGINTYHVLGHFPAPEKLLTPKMISLKALKLGLHHKPDEILGIGAAKYHSLFHTKDELFTFGLNVGQIGHQKGERTQIVPHQVSALNFRDTGTTLEHVVTSDGAIVCATNKGDVFVLHEYQCRKVASQQFDIQQICVVGGHLDERTDVAGILDNSRLELKIMLLTKMRNIFLWKGTDPMLVRCLIGFGRELSVTHICLNTAAVGIVTKDGEIFFGNLLNRKTINNDLKKPITEHSSESNTKSQTKTNSKPTPNKASVQQVKTFVKFINKDECHTIKVRKQPYIHRAVAIFSDDKNRNFSVLQSSPKVGMLTIPAKPDSQMVTDFKSLYESIHFKDDIYDILIKVGNRQYFAHKFILSNRSEYFRKKISSDSDCKTITLETNFVSSDSFEQIIKFMYFNSNDLFVNESKLNWNQLKATKVDESSKNSNKKQTSKKNKENASDPLNELRESSKKLGINWFHKWLSSNSVKIVGNKVKLLDNCPPPKLTFDRLKYIELSDISVKSEDGIEFNCHKCILMSRLEYFRGMLGSGWVEASASKALNLPIPSKILEIIIDYIYKDEVPKLMANEDPEFICQVLVIADQYLIPSLKTYCEYVLVNLLTLKNASELLELSYIYNAEQLKRCCLDFIRINIQTLFESKSIDILSDEAMDDLSTSYQDLVTRPRSRSISRYSSAPNAEELEQIFSLFNSEEDFNVNMDEKKALLKQKSRPKRSSRQRNESTSSDIIESEDISISKLSLNSPQREDSEDKRQLESPKLLNKSDVNNVNAFHTNTELSVKSKPQTIKWGITSSTIRPPMSLKDIITEEETTIKELTKLTKLNNSNNFQLSSTFKQNSKSIPIPKTYEFSIESNSSSPKSFAAMAVSPPKLNSNPWKKIESTSPTTPTAASYLSSYPKMETISMRDIVRAEQEQLQNLRSLEAKPLHIISIEDKAIEELLIHYKAKDNPEEYIVVKRVLIDANKIASPVWKRH